MTLLIIIILNILILSLWHRSLKKKGKKLAWYWGWILPTDVIALSLITLFGIAVIIISAFDMFSFKEKRTIDEMNEIKKSILKYHNDKSVFPNSLQELIGQNPLRREWKFDNWNTQYKLIYQNEEEMKIISAGSDRKFDTEDDLKMKLKTDANTK